MDRKTFAATVEGVALNSQLAEHCDHQRGHVATEAEQDQLETEMRAYFDRRNDQMRQLHAWFDQTASRLERADRIEAAAGESQATIYRARCLLCETQRLRNREAPAKVAELVAQAERLLWDAWNAQNAALAEPSDDAGRRES